jgi:uncharacterized protein involved in exopolysaccharide biosynthesis
MSARSTRSRKRGGREGKGADDRQVAFEDFIGVVRRRGSAFALTFGAVMLVGVALAFKLPPIYTSTGVLVAEQPAVPDYVVRSTVPDYPEERVRIVTQRVLTADNLRTIAESNSLYPELAGSDGLVLREIRDNIKLSAESPEMLENILGSGPNASMIAFSIAFSDPQPATARDVARDLVDLYLHENQAARREQAAATADFLSIEVEALSRDLAEREQQIAQFKRDNAGSLPEIGEDNRDFLDRVDRDLEEVEREIRTLREREELYSAELAELSPYAAIVDENGETILGPTDQLRVLQRRYLQLSAVYGEDYPELVRLRREIAALDGVPGGVPAFDVDGLRVELELREAELVALRERYSPEYPEVRRAEQIVTSLRRQIAEAPRSATPGRALAPDNPAYIQRRVMLEGTRTDLRAALDRRETLRQRMAELENQLSISPEIEREYRALTRGYDQLLAQYNDAEAKLREATTAVNLESDARGERFVVLAEPSLPARPSKPNRLAVILLTLVVAGGIGATVVAMGERRDDTVRNANEVMKILGIPPLAAIPQIATATDLRRKRFQRVLGFAAVCAWGAMIALLVITPAT